MKSVCRAESIFSALSKNLGKRNVIEAFDQSYPQSTLRTELAKHTNLTRWAILAVFDHCPTLNPATVTHLANDTDWVEQGCNILVFGPSSTGKTHVAKAIDRLIHHAVVLEMHGESFRQQQAKERLLPKTKTDSKEVVKTAP